MEIIRKIGIVGSRRRNASYDYKIVLNKFLEMYQEGDIIVSGGCPEGADSFAEDIGRKNGIPFLIFPANWKKYGKSAGFVRNKDISDNSDILIACVAPDRKGGTENTIKYFKNKNNFDKSMLHII
ncbi:MAG: SLOG family protein [Acidithiobacillus sp.]|jgi:hypothetical protein|uniref:SLOG family protein n=1 Tax=Acidithiobacillus sp. TaxID=1872118 RepID=UPI00356045B8